MMKPHGPQKAGVFAQKIGTFASLICIIVSGWQNAHAQTTWPVEGNTGLFEFELYQLPARSGPTFLLKGADNNLWFADIGRNEIVRFDIAEQKLRAFPLLYPDTGIVVMANGPDGNVWFPDYLRGAIAKVTSDGEISEITMPHHAAVAGLGAGPDDTLWMTEGVNDKIARYDLRTQTFKEFQLPHPASGPCKILTGPDGAIWFTELAGNRVGRLTLHGELTEFTVPTPHAEPFMIINGPDGNLWFAEYNAGKVGRITTRGEITEFPTSSPASFPMHLVVGPDQNIWFTEVGGNALGRITTSGELTEFTFGGPADSSTSPDGITVGSDNRVWFTQYTGNALGAVLSTK